jgi:2,3-bisphosphoglycerate-dependent phosphoglycerate mutase
MEGTSGRRRTLPRLVLLRHGQSVWNRDNRFTGWTDVDLSEQGVAEAREAARLLAASGIAFDHCFTSVLKRAIRTLWIVLDEMDAMWLPVCQTWRLNERHYGALQGLDKARTGEDVGVAQLHVWRRSYNGRPPALALSDPRHPAGDRRYALVPRAQLPAGESLADTVARVLPFWHERIEPVLIHGRTVLVVAHGNSLRGLVMYLDGLGEDEVAELEIPTGTPLVYDFDEGLTPTLRRRLHPPAEPV